MLQYLAAQCYVGSINLLVGEKAPFNQYKQRSDELKEERRQQKEKEEKTAEEKQQSIEKDELSILPEPWKDLYRRMKNSDNENLSHDQRTAFRCALLKTFCSRDKLPQISDKAAAILLNRMDRGSLSVDLKVDYAAMLLQHVNLNPLSQNPHCSEIGIDAMTTINPVDFDIAEIAQWQIPVPVALVLSTTNCKDCQRINRAMRRIAKQYVGRLIVLRIVRGTASNLNATARKNLNKLASDTLDPNRQLNEWNKGEENVILFYKGDPQKQIYLSATAETDKDDIDYYAKQIDGFFAERQIA